MLNFTFVLSMWLLRTSSSSLFPRGRWCWCSACTKGSVTLISSIKMIQLSPCKKTKQYLTKTGSATPHCSSGPVLSGAGAVNSILAMCLGKQHVSDRNMAQLQLPNSSNHGSCPSGSSVTPLNTPMCSHFSCTLPANTLAQGATLHWIFVQHLTQ